MNHDPTNPRLTEHEGYPYASTPREQIRFIANYAALAPSPFNSQPWRFRITENALEIHPDLSRWLHVVDPEGHDLALSCGASATNAATAIRHFGMGVNIDKTSGAEIGENWLLRLTIAGEQERTAANALLFHAIRNRHTSRKPFSERLIPQPLMDDIKDAARSAGVKVASFNDVAQRIKIATLWDELLDEVGKDDARENEVRKWIGTQDPQRHDGEPVAASGIDQLHYHWVHLTRGGKGLMEESQQRSRMRIMASPRLVVISTAEDNLSEWLSVGMAMENALLRASSPGVQASFLGQLTCRKEDRQRTREALELEDIPQAVLCMGFSVATPTTPRRSMSELIMP